MHPHHLANAQLVKADKLTISPDRRVIGIEHHRLCSAVR